MAKTMAPPIINPGAIFTDFDKLRETCARCAEPVQYEKDGTKIWCACDVWNSGNTVIFGKWLKGGRRG